MTVNFIGLKVSNPYWNALAKVLKNEFIDYLIPEDYNKGKYDFVDMNPHITLMFNESFPKGPNWAVWYCSIKLRDLYTQLRSAATISTETAQLDTFNNEDKTVLKFNLSKCNVFDILNSYYGELHGLCKDKPTYDMYRPHITVAAINPSAPPELIEEIKSKILLSNYNLFNIEGLLIGGPGYEKFYNI